MWKAVPTTSRTPLTRPAYWIVSSAYRSFGLTAPISGHCAYWSSDSIQPSVSGSTSSLRKSRYVPRAASAPRLHLSEKLKGPSWAERLRRGAAASAGGLAAFLALQFGAQQHGVGAPLLAGGCLVLGLGSYLLVAIGRSPYWGLYLAALCAGATGVLL